MAKYRIVTGKGKKKIVEAESFDDAVQKTFSSEKWVKCKKGEKGYNKANIKVQGQTEKSTVYYQMVKLRPKQPNSLFLAVLYWCSKYQISVSEKTYTKDKITLTLQGDSGVSIKIEADSLDSFVERVQKQSELLQKNKVGDDLVAKLEDLVQDFHKAA